MQRKTKSKASISRKVYVRSVTLRIDDKLHKKIANRATELAHTTLGMKYTVSDVIRMILTKAMEAEDHQEMLGNLSRHPEVASEEGPPALAPAPNTET